MAKWLGISVGMTAVMALSACGGGDVATSEASKKAVQGSFVPNPIDDTQRLAAGYEHVVSVDADGKVYVWGRNDAGQLGTTSTNNYSDTPVQVSGMSGVRAVKAGALFTVLLKDDGTVWMLTKTGAQQISGIDNIKAIATGQSHVLALRSDGNVWGWGRGATIPAGVSPVVVAGLSNVKAISAGQDFSAALKSDGSVWTWGSNIFGQLGNGSTATASQPGMVAGLSNVEAISAGLMHMLALKTDGTVWGWGNNSYGQLGGSGTARYTPVAIQGLPAVIAGMSGVRKVVAGSYNSGVLNHDGSVWLWGNNQYGQLGNGSTAPAFAPQKVNAINNAVALAISGISVSVLRADGSVYSFGRNNVGQLGNHTTTNASTPVQVTGVAGSGNLNLGPAQSN